MPRSCRGDCYRGYSCPISRRLGKCRGADGRALGRVGVGFGGLGPVEFEADGQAHDDTDEQERLDAEDGAFELAGPGR